MGWNKGRRGGSETGPKIRVIVPNSGAEFSQGAPPPSVLVIGQRFLQGQTFGALTVGTGDDTLTFSALKPGAAAPYVELIDDGGPLSVDFDFLDAPVVRVHYDGPENGETHSVQDIADFLNDDYESNYPAGVGVYHHLAGTVAGVGTGSIAGFGPTQLVGGVGAGVHVVTGPDDTDVNEWTIFPAAGPTGGGPVTDDTIVLDGSYLGTMTWYGPGMYRLEVISNNSRDTAWLYVTA